MRWIRKNRDRNWHRWFAWYPVELSSGPHRTGTHVWLEWVERASLEGQHGMIHHYREPRKGRRAA